MEYKDLFKKVPISQMTFDEFNNNFDLELEKRKYSSVTKTNVYINNIFVYQFSGEAMPLTSEEFGKIKNNGTRYKKIKNYDVFLKNHYAELKKEIHRHYTTYCIKYGILIPKKVFDEYKKELFWFVEGDDYYHYYIRILIKELKYIKRIIKNK